MSTPDYRGAALSAVSTALAIHRSHPGTAAELGPVLGDILEDVYAGSHDRDTVVATTTGLMQEMAVIALTLIEAFALVTGQTPESIWQQTALSLTTTKGTTE